MAGNEQLRAPAGGATEAGRRRASRLLELEFGKSWDFDDPKHEWRRLFSELLDTFFLVLVGAGGAVVNAHSGGAISRTAAVTAPGRLGPLQADDKGE
jgi:aquaporin Z